MSERTAHTLVYPNGCPPLPILFSKPSQGIKDARTTFRRFALISQRDNIKPPKAARQEAGGSVGRRDTSPMKGRGLCYGRIFSRAVHRTSCRNANEKNIPTFSLDFGRGLYLFFLLPPALSKNCLSFINYPKSAIAQLSEILN
jgi:hypothetical protein